MRRRTAGRAISPVLLGSIDSLSVWHLLVTVVLVSHPALSLFEPQCNAYPADAHDRGGRGANNNNPLLVTERQAPSAHQTLANAPFDMLGIPDIAQQLGPQICR